MLVIFSIITGLILCRMSLSLQVNREAHSNKFPGIKSKSSKVAPATKQRNKQNKTKVHASDEQTEESE